MGVMPLTFTEVSAYFGLFNIEHNSTELDILFLIDNIYLQEKNREGVEND